MGLDCGILPVQRSVCPSYDARLSAPRCAASRVYPEARLCEPLGRHHAVVLAQLLCFFRLHDGARVESLDGDTRGLEGEVRNSNTNGTFLVVFDNGAREFAMEARQLRRVEKRGQGRIMITTARA